MTMKPMPTVAQTPDREVLLEAFFLVLPTTAAGADAGLMLMTGS